jgi:hypothetical protein
MGDCASREAKCSVEGGRSGNVSGFLYVNQKTGQAALIFRILPFDKTPIILCVLFPSGPLFESSNVGPIITVGKLVGQ